MMRFKTLLLILCLFITSDIHAIEGELKASIRDVFGTVSRTFNSDEFGPLPEGMSIIIGDNFRGLKICQGDLEIRIDAWSSDEGLLERFEAAKNRGLEIHAVVNGTFYASRGPLGSVISDGRFPKDMTQVPGSLSRCFFASFRGDKDRQYWYLGETSVRGSDLLTYGFKNRGWFNVPEEIYGNIDQFLGGGGWVLRNRKDMSRDAYDRQRFRFRAEDQTSRKTVVAQDEERNLYLIVFDLGYTFHMVARTLVKDEKFAGVRDAIFFDGGSSSAIVLNGKYLVAPLYIVDRARFTAIQILSPIGVW